MVDLCAQAAKTTGPVSLFLGVETASWMPQAFVGAASFAKQFGISCLFVKVAEVGSPAGDIWYGGIDGADKVITSIKATGMAVVPYAYLYGDADLDKEIAIALQLLTKYGVLCLDIEMEWSGQTANAAKLAAALEPIVGQLWISTLANPAEHGLIGVLQALMPATNAFMPQVYDDYLAGVYEAQWKQVGPVCLHPTIDLSNEFGPDNIAAIAAQIRASGAQALSFWEYAFAMQQQALLGQIIGGNRVGLVTNNGAVINLIKSFQLDNANNESQDMCGPWSVAELKFGALPPNQPTALTKDIDDWAELEYEKYIGPNVITNQQGSSVDNMHSFLKDAGLHWWDIAAINPSSKQSDDLANLHAALDAGYPVLVTVNELSVVRRDGSNPYPWQPKLGPVNHVFTLVGRTFDGFLLVDDELNQNDAWPDQYKESSLQCSWACVVQVQGLAPIPSGTPLTWPKGFIAQQGGKPVVTPTPTPGPDAFTLEADTVWSAVYVSMEKMVQEALTKANIATQAMALDSPPIGTGIYQSWIAEWKAGRPRGPALTFEYRFNRSTDGKLVARQDFTGGSCEWQLDTGIAHW